MSKAKYLIIGNSAAAVGAVTGIRQVDPEGSIIIISREPEHTYSRPLITYLLGGKVGEGDMDYRPRDFYKRKKVEAILGEAVTAIDAKAKKATTDQGREIGYDKLLIATGGRPIVPPDLEGVDSEGVFTFTSWADAKAMLDYMAEHKVERAVVIGGGLIGLKSVDALLMRGVGVTVVELAPRVMSAGLDEAASEMAHEALRGQGVDLRLERTVKKIEASSGRVKGVKLSDGEKVACQMVILAIGVVPDTTLAGEGVETDRGIVVDESMATSAPDVYAAGDVAQGLEMISGEKRAIPIWPTAYRMGLVAGGNMAGGGRAYEGGLPMNSVEVCGLPFISAGLNTALDGSYEVLTAGGPGQGAYKKVIIKDGRLVGSVLVGDIDRAGILTGLIQSRLDVSAFKDQLLADEFGLICLPADYRGRLAGGQGAQQCA